MHFGSKYAYLGNNLEDDEEVKIDDEEGIVLSDSDVSDDDGESCLVHIFDTAGQEEYSSLKDRRVREGNGFVIIYSITHRESFNVAEAVYKWVKKVKYDDDDSYCILVANKQDLSDEAVISQAEGKELATRLGIQLYETSAKTGQGIVDAMHGLVRIIPRTGTDYKVVMLGSGAVGKSCITLRFVSNTFVSDYDPSIEDSYRKWITIPGLTAVSKNAKRAFKERKKRHQRNPDVYSAGASPSLRNTPSASSSGLSADGYNRVQQRKADGNMMLIELRSLADEPKLVTGDAIKCANCSVIMTSTSTLASDGDKKIWICEFCGHSNCNLDLDEDEVPKDDCFDYLLSPATKPKEEIITEEAAAPTKETKPGVIVYCMDVSLSMRKTFSAPASQRAWREERTSGTETIDRVTKLDCIRKAVERLADQFREEQPDKQILLTTFSSKLYVKAGGPSEKSPEFTKLKDKTFDELLQIGCQLSDDYPLKPISESYNDIASVLGELRTSRSTALGPALSICTGFASKIPNSEVVLCTDGKPNVGVGSIREQRDEREAEEFYRMIGQYARSKNIIINILAINGYSVRLRSVMAAAANSGGTTNKLNPMEFIRQLRTIAQNEIVASAVTVRVFLHPDFVFDEPDYGENLSQLEKEIGQARKESDLTFHYKLRDPTKKEVLDKVPFQVQITYTRLDGTVCLRTLSKEMETTTSRQSMEQNIEVSVLGTVAMKKTAKLAKAGRSKEAQAMLKSVKRLVHRGAVSSQQREERSAFEEEIKQLDGELTNNNAGYACQRQSDDSITVTSQALSKSVGQQQASSRKMDEIMKRKMKSTSSEQYYKYRDSF